MDEVMARALRGVAALASVERPHTAENHRLTAVAWTFVNDLGDQRRGTIHNVLREFLEMATEFDTSDAPSLTASLADDGAVLLEWTFQDRRLGITFEEDPKESGWYFVFSSGPSTRYEAGTLDQMRLRHLVNLALH